MDEGKVFNVVRVVFVMNKKGLVGLIAVVGVLLAVGFFLFVGKMGSVDVECVPASCCHATECVLVSEAPNCDGVFCSMNCEPGTLDCGQGHCEFLDNECGVVK